mmetsp:Transcript_14219/g.21865  ORF Transcript_14219/g.21865 Transcript_14219/m.21865 type:complete len:101 (+) Transcript_14219:278-580(+)
MATYTRHHIFIPLTQRTYMYKTCSTSNTQRYITSYTKTSQNPTVEPKSNGAEPSWPHRPPLVDTTQSNPICLQVLIDQISSSNTSSTCSRPITTDADHEK